MYGKLAARVFVRVAKRRAFHCYAIPILSIWAYPEYRASSSMTNAYKRATQARQQELRRAFILCSAMPPTSCLGM